VPPQNNDGVAVGFQWTVESVPTPFVDAAFALGLSVLESTRTVFLIVIVCAESERLLISAALLGSDAAICVRAAATCVVNSPSPSITIVALPEPGSRKTIAITTAETFVAQRREPVNLRVQASTVFEGVRMRRQFSRKLTSFDLSVPWNTFGCPLSGPV